MPEKLAHRILQLGIALLIGGVLPAVFVTIDAWLLEYLAVERSDLLVQALIGSFILRFALLGLLCLRFVAQPWLRAALLVWCVVLFDLQAEQVGRMSSLWKYTEAWLDAFLLAQFILVVIWSVLSVPWKVLRWLAILAVIIYCSSLLRFGVYRSIRDYSNWLFLQTLVCAGLCAILRWRKYQISIDPPTPATFTGAPHPARQIPLRYLFFAITAVSVLLALTIAVGPWFVRFLRRSTVPEYFEFLICATLAAMAFVAATYGALSRQNALKRIPLSLIGIAAFSYASTFLLHTHFFDLVISRSRYLFLKRFWTVAWQAEFGKLTMLLLAVAMVYFTLLAFRWQGYRLEKRPPSVKRLSARKTRVGGT